MSVDLTALRPGAFAAAQRLILEVRKAIIISGRRSLEGQAMAMADNVIHNRYWIEETYFASNVSQTLQLFVSENWSASFGLQPGYRSEFFARGMLSILRSYGTEELHHLSWHLSGEAFDVQQGTKQQDKIVASLRGIIKDHIKGGGLAKLLLKEGGLPKIHLQIDDPRPTPESIVLNSDGRAVGLEPV